jgi:hypothetical protein
VAGTTPKTITITNVRPFQSIGLKFPVEVAYAAGNPPSGIITVACAGSGVTPAQANVVLASGNFTFDVAHQTADSGHTLTAKLTQGGNVVASCDITNVSVLAVNVNDAGPITIANYDGLEDGLPVVKPIAALAGTFKPEVGNKVMILVEQLNIDGGQVHPPRLVFADEAEVEVKGAKGKWNHAAIPNARPGHRLIVVLTKNGETKALMQAIFK